MRTGYFIFDRYPPKGQLQYKRQCLSHRRRSAVVESKLKKFNTLNTISFFINNYILTYFWAVVILL